MDAEENQIEYLKERYDAERDGGNMTWADRSLLELVESLLKKIAMLESRVECLENPSEYDALMLVEAAQRHYGR